MNCLTFTWVYEKPIYRISSPGLFSWDIVEMLTPIAREFSLTLICVLFNKCFHILVVNCGWTSFTTLEQYSYPCYGTFETSATLSDHMWIFHTMFCRNWRLFEKHYDQSWTHETPPPQKKTKGTSFFHIYD